MDFSFICKNVPEDGKPWLSSHPSMTETAQGGAAMQSCASALAVRDSSTARHPSPASWTASAGGEDRSLCHQLWRCQSRWYRVPANSRNAASAWVCVGVRTSGTGPLGSRTTQADLSEVKIQEEALTIQGYFTWRDRLRCVLSMQAPTIQGAICLHKIII